MPNHRKLDRWEVKGEPGYIIPRAGVAYLRIGSIYRSLHIPFLPSYRQLGLDVLKRHQRESREREARQLLGLDAPASPVPPAVREMISLHAVIEEFERSRYPHLTINEIKNFQRPISYYLGGFNLEWNRADAIERERAVDLIYTELAERHVAPGLAANVRRKYTGHLQHLFAFMVERKHLASNPALLLTKPKKVRGTRRTRWLPEECDVILYHLEQLAPSGYYPLCIHFLMLTGMRPGEAMKLTRREAVGMYLPATGKGATRELPISALPMLREVLDDLLRLPPASKRAWLLFPWNNLTKVRIYFNEAVRRSGVDRKERTLYCCRKSAIWWMEDELLMHRQDIFDMVGHSEKIDDEYYREGPSGQELEKRIQRRRVIEKAEEI